MYVNCQTFASIEQMQQSPVELCAQVKSRPVSYNDVFWVNYACISQQGSDSPV